MDHARLPTLVRELRSAGLSDAAVTVALRRWSDGKGSSYDAGWRSWAEYCTRRSISPTHPPTIAATVADWLSSMVVAGAKYSKFDNFRSSVCVLLDMIGSSNQLATSPLVKSMSRAAASDMNRMPKYSDCLDLERVWDMFRAWGPTATLSDDRLLAKAITSMMIDSAARSSDLARWQGWCTRSCALLPPGSSWATATEATLRFFRTKEVNMAIKVGNRRSQFSDGIRIRKIRPKMVRDAAVLDTFTTLDCYSARVRDKLPALPPAPTAPAAATPVHRAFFLALRPDRHGTHAFLGEERIAAIAKATLKEAGVDTVKFQAHAIRGETLSKLRALGWPSVELLPLSRHSTVKALERSYIRRAPERVLALKIIRARYLPEEALRL